MSEKTGKNGALNKGSTECAHPEKGVRYLFTPEMGKKVVAITYCKKCGRELAREPSTVAKDK